MDGKIRGKTGCEYIPGGSMVSIDSERDAVLALSSVCDSASC